MTDSEELVVDARSGNGLRPKDHGDEILRDCGQSEANRRGDRHDEREDLQIGRCQSLGFVDQLHVTGMERATDRQDGRERGNSGYLGTEIVDAGRLDPHRAHHDELVEFGDQRNHPWSSPRPRTTTAAGNGVPAAKTTVDTDE